MRDEGRHNGHLAVYRHDVHKFLRRSHVDRRDTFEGIRVNESVGYGADRDAARLSRPDGEPSAQLDAHVRHERLSLLSGRSVAEDAGYATDDCEYRTTLRELLSHETAAEAHRAWLYSWLPAVFNESVHYPYTSLKYHTLLVAALYDAYDRGYSFDDLSVVVDPPSRVEPHRTVYADDRFGLRIDVNTPPSRSTLLGTTPSRSWATVWNTLPEHPLAVESDRFEMVLDSQLRRIRSWSTALQYIEDFEAWRPTR
ncbi:hypothetical protein [Halobaculum sp. EA56]|uniref:hypothetical protein n=1 Tax=Halobaculum sp. EA56 TaxID=3421648 RepID=UPI003EBB6432